MKAKDYFEKYKDDMSAAMLLDSEKATPEERRDVVNRLLDSINAMSIEMLNEIDDICKQSHVILPSSRAAVVKEINGKWNAVCRLFVKEFGESPIKEDAINMDVYGMRKHE